MNSMLAAIVSATYHQVTDNWQDMSVMSERALSTMGQTKRQDDGMRYLK